MSFNKSASDTPIHNSNRYSTRQLVIMALMCAVAILLSFVEFPLFPWAAFLKLDIALVPSTVIGFAYGTGPGLLVGVASAVAHAAITGNWVGALMNCIVACAYIAPAALIYRKHSSLKGLIVSLSIATICLTLAAIIANLIIDPLLYGMPFEAVTMLVIPAILPFNIIKGAVVSIVCALAYRSLAQVIEQSTQQS